MEHHLLIGLGIFFVLFLCGVFVIIAIQLETIANNISTVNTTVKPITDLSTTAHRRMIINDWA